MRGATRKRRRRRRSYRRSGSIAALETTFRRRLRSSEVIVSQWSRCVSCQASGGDLKAICLTTCILLRAASQIKCNQSSVESTLLPNLQDLSFSVGFCLSSCRQSLFQKLSFPTNPETTSTKNQLVQTSFDRIREYYYFLPLDRMQLD